VISVFVLKRILQFPDTPAPFPVEGKEMLVFEYPRHREVKQKLGTQCQEGSVNEEQTHFRRADPELAGPPRANAVRSHLEEKDYFLDRSHLLNTLCPM
jgi:hypothetical protein